MKKKYMCVSVLLSNLSPASGIVVPLVGAVPDSAIIIVSGLGDDAKLSSQLEWGELLNNIYNDYIQLKDCLLSEHSHCICSLLFCSHGYNCLLFFAFVCCEFLHGHYIYNIYT